MRARDWPFTEVKLPPSTIFPSGCISTVADGLERIENITRTAVKRYVRVRLYHLRSSRENCTAKCRIAVFNNVLETGNEAAAYA